MVRLTAVAIAVAVIVALAVAIGCGRDAAARPPRHLFLITVDTLRADHMSLYGYARATTPRLDRLAERGTVFERAIAQWPKTGSSFASVMTGRYPQSTGLTHEAALRVPEGLPVLSELFRDHGFTTLAVVSNAVLSRELGWDRGFDEYVESWHGELTADPVGYRKLLYAGRVNQLARALIEKHRDDERLLVWVHYSDPHAPYILPDGAANPFLDDAIYRETPELRVQIDGRNGRRIAGRDDLRYYVAQYDANIEVVDRHASELIAGLDDLGLLEDSAIVFFADHGEDLGEHRHSYFEHGRWPYNTSAHVPLFVIGPGVAAGRRVQPAVELVDLFPTLAAWLLPEAEHAGLEGEELLSSLGVTRTAGAPGAAAERSLAFSEAGRRGRDRFRTVQDQRFKLIYAPQRRSRPPRIELYDLASDPLEKRNLAGSPEGDREVRRLLRPLQEWMKGAAASAAASEPRTEDQIKALKALGYVD